MKRKAKILFVQQHVSVEVLILLGKRIASGETFWWIPGGSVEAGESDFQAGIRELDEELFLTDDYTNTLASYIQSNTVPASIEYQSSNADNIIFIVPIRTDINQLPKIKDEFEELRWFSLNSLPENMSREFQYIQQDFEARVKSLLLKV